MPVGTIYCVKMKQTYFTQDCLNIFFYRQSGVTLPGLSDADGLFEAFDDDFLVDWKGMVNGSVSIPEVEVFAVADPTDNKIATPTNSTGTRTPTDNLRAPSWIAAGFKSNRIGTGSRSSYKRFTGLMEADIDDNVISPTFIALAATVAVKAALGAIINAVGGSAYTPIQVAANWVLGFPPTENFVLSSWIDPTLTSQVSRKP